jgi:phosphohistidine phosphatase SixA
MKLFHTCTALLLAALAACATVEREPASPSYYVMRHLQKADGTDPGLTEEGRRHAERLVTLLAGDPPAAVYASSTRRAQETAAPIAGRLGLATKSYDPRDIDGLVGRVKAEPGTVLVVGHSNTVPDIVEKLGGVRPAPLAETDYGDVWRISRAGGATEKKGLGEG